MSLYVGNLHPDCSDAVLFKKFSPVGKISSVKVCRDSQTSTSLGYGYIIFEKEEDAKKCMDTMNYDLLYGRNIRIMWAQKKPCMLPKGANLIVKNLHSSVNELDLKEMCCPFGEIVSIKVARNSKGDAKGYGYIQFEDEEAAEWAMSSLNGKELKQKKLYVSKFIPADERKSFQDTAFPNNIFVRNLTDITTKELVEMCQAFGDVVSAKVITDDKNKCKGLGYVSFKDKEGAEKAILELNRLCLNGKVVSAQYAWNKKYNGKKKM